MWCKVFVFIVGLVIAQAMQAQEVALDWAKAMGGMAGSSSAEGKSIAIDAIGNVYTTGSFRGPVDFDPSNGNYNIISQGITQDAFISKVDALGNFVWAKRIGGNSDDYGYSITTDAVGNIYTTGSFRGTVDFDPNIGVSNLTSSLGSDVFICKLDASGNFVWAKRIGSYNTQSSFSTSISVDAMGNVYTTGSFSGVVDFDPGVGFFNIMESGTPSIFVSKLDTLGNFVWAKHFNGTSQGESIKVDNFGNVYIAGYFSGTVDFDPNTGIFNLTSAGQNDVFVSKLDVLGNFVWVKRFGSTGSDFAGAMEVDLLGNIYTTGRFRGTVDFDPGVGVFNLVDATTSSGDDVFVSKLDSLGNFVWARHFEGTASFRSYSIVVDVIGNIYTVGYFLNSINFIGFNSSLTSLGSEEVFISKLNSSGNFVWAKRFGGTSEDVGQSIEVDFAGNIYATGVFTDLADFNPNFGTTTLSLPQHQGLFILKLRQKGVSGYVYQDFDQNCSQDIYETTLMNQTLIINPGNIIVTTNNNGIWFIDSLPTGNYTITADTSSINWQITCPVTQNFTIAQHDSVTLAPSFGFRTTNLCSAPDIFIYTPFLRPGFSNPKVYIQACNENLGTDFINNGYIIVELDSLLTVQTASMPYTSLGNNQYQINIDTLYPGQCVDFWLGCTLSTNAILGQTLCMNAKLYPVDSCALDAVPSPQPSTPLGEVTPCTLPWDRSSLRIDAACINNDSVRFIIYNTGLGMNCFAPVRIYLDGQLIQLDSIQLAGGDSTIFMLAGNGQTWRLEADQHPLHPGNSQPNATIENCGTGTWTPNLVNILPMDDADPIIDIYCGLVTGSYDPNDKTGYPLGVGNNHDILPFQDMEYVIRFQNTGTDTAFTIVIRDTLSTDFNIFSVRSGVSSHDYSFKMYGPRVLEWTFNNIMLPDSNVNEPASHGFVKFKVHHAAGLTNGTVTENSAAIYFDFNPPIFTNTSWHTINDYLNIGNAVSTIASIQNSTKVYPNPTSGQITLQIEQRFNAANIQIVNTLGQIISASRTSDAMSELTLPNAVGIYFVRVEIDGVVQTHKVVRE